MLYAGVDISLSRERSELSTFFFGSYQQQTTHHQQPFLLGTLLDDSLIPFRSFSCIVRFRRGFVFCK